MPEYQYNDDIADKSFVHHIELPMPDGLILDSESVSTVFISDDSEISEPIDFSHFVSDTLRMDVAEVQRSLREKDEVKKSFEGSTQSQDEQGFDVTVNLTGNLQTSIVQTPYDPVTMARFMECNEVHKSAVIKKVTDSLLRKYKIIPRFPIRKDESDDVDEHGFFVSEVDFQLDCRKIISFLQNVDDCEDFEEINKKVGMDYEAIGWAGYEVIRNALGKVVKLKHVPASRLRVLRGFTGFVEIDSGSRGSFAPIYTYYQPFGSKVVVSETDPFDDSNTIIRNYDPELDGELNIFENENLSWNLKSRKTGESIPFSPENFMKEAANELLYLPNVHNNSVYYGYTDIVPAIGALLANSYIQDYRLKFFENDCVPRFAVVIKGAKIDDAFKKHIHDYFENKIKGSAHKTIILTLTGMSGSRIDIEFKKLNDDNMESSFIETRKQNDSIIMIAHDVSAAILGITEAASLGSGKGNAQHDLYIERTVIPKQLYWARKLNKIFRLGLGCVSAVIEFDPLRITDSLKAAQAMQIFLTMGVISINEARRQLGMESIDGGDKVFLRLRDAKSLLKVEDLPHLTSLIEQMPNGSNDLNTASDTVLGTVEDDLSVSIYGNATQEQIEALQQTVEVLVEFVEELRQSALDQSSP